MSIVSFDFFVFIGLFLILYYLIKRKYQWCCLLIMSVIFYLVNTGQAIVWILFTIAGTYIFALIIENLRERNSDKKLVKFIFIIDVLVALSPLILLKYIWGRIFSGIVLPLGISFYTLQLIGYSCDVYKGKYNAERNILKYALFAMFFPHVIQGPIARYDQLSDSLYKEHDFDEKKVTSGFMLVLWGLFLKLVLADRAAVIVDAVYADYSKYAGICILIAGILYSIQLYADFMGCVNIARGVALMFGVELVDNFNHPYFSVSIKDFWRRWHISLSSWLRDYVYIPLGGNRKGTIRKYVNLMVTFLVSGFWHGVGLQFIFWGALHGIYQIIGDFTRCVRIDLKEKLRIKDSVLDLAIQRICTFFLVMVAWIFFRATSLKQGIEMIILMVKDFNITGLSGSVVFSLGLGMKEICLLCVSILVLVSVSILQERIHIREKIQGYPIVFRYIIYIVFMCIILLFGKYGSGYDAGQFIYGGF